jgi:hypothetical protein
MNDADFDLKVEYILLDSFLRSCSTTIHQLSKAMIEQDLVSLADKLLTVRMRWSVVRNALNLSGGLYDHFQAVLEGILDHSNYSVILALLKNQSLSLELLPDLEELSDHRLQNLKSKGIL